MRLKLSILSVPALAALAACSDLEEVPITGVTSSYFNTPAGAQASVTGAYSRLRDLYGQQREITLLEVGTDSWEKGGEAGADAPFNDYTPVLAANMSNTTNRDNWQSMYLAVNAANTALAAVDSVNGVSDAQRLVLQGEVRFLRALYYFNLVRMYGDVTLNLEPTVGVVTEATRTPAAEVYTQAIVPDLEFAVANLPATQAQFGRATKGAAQTLLAEVYLTRAASGDFDKARDLTTAVIGSGSYALNGSFRGLFCGPERVGGPCDFVAANETNREFIWGVQFTGDGVNDPFGDNLHLYYVMAYDIAGGRGLNTRTVEYGRPFRRLRPTLHLLRLWNKTTDSRYDDTFQTLWVATAGTRDTAIYMPGTPTTPAAYVGKPYLVVPENNYTPILFPTLKKWLDNTRNNDPNRFPGARDRYLWRLAEVYLMRAEANIRAGRTADAVADFNVIRARAARAGQTNTMGATELAAFAASPIDFLLDERERELAGEEFRWFTLTRLNKLVDRVKAYNTAGAPNVAAKHQLRPIPQEQIDRVQGGAYGQNPGY